MGGDIVRGRQLLLDITPMTPRHRDAMFLRAKLDLTNKLLVQVIFVARLYVGKKKTKVNIQPHCFYPDRINRSSNSRAVQSLHK